MKFYCYPKKLDRCLIYSNYKLQRNKLFSELLLQLTPKNSIFYRLRNSYLGHVFTSFSRLNLDVPSKDGEYIGIKKEDRIILFEFNDDKPNKVYKMLNGSTKWSVENFIGHQIIREYSLDEIHRKITSIEKAFSLQKNLNEQSNFVHGDFTHFNILVNDEDEIQIIDELNSENSALYDVFYFYSYLKQNMERRKNLSPVIRNKILELVGKSIIKIYSYDKKSEFEMDFNSIKIPTITGLLKQNHKRYLKEFYSLFYPDV